MKFPKKKKKKKKSVATIASNNLQWNRNKIPPTPANNLYGGAEITFNNTANTRYIKELWPSQSYINPKSICSVPKLTKSRVKYYFLEIWSQFAFFWPIDWKT